MHVEYVTFFECSLENEFGLDQYHPFKFKSNFLTFIKSLKTGVNMPRFPKTHISNIGNKHHPHLIILDIILNIFFPLHTTSKINQDPIVSISVYMCNRIKNFYLLKINAASHLQFTFLHLHISCSYINYKN
jgi:hypothetical protein